MVVFLKNEMGCARASRPLLNLKLIFTRDGPEMAIVADARGNDGDGLGRRGVAVEEFGVEGSIGPSGAEALGALSIRGPGIVAGIRGEIRREADDDGCCAEDIAVPIHDGSRRCGVDGDFDRFRLRAFDLGVGLGLRCGAGSEEQSGKDGGGGCFHGSELMEELVTLSAHLRC